MSLADDLLRERLAHDRDAFDQRERDAIDRHTVDRRRMDALADQLAALLGARR